VAEKIATTHAFVDFKSGDVVIEFPENYPIQIVIACNSGVPSAENLRDNFIRRFNKRHGALCSKSVRCDVECRA